MKLGISLFIFRMRRFETEQIPFSQSLDMCRAAGFDTFDMPFYHSGDPNVNDDLTAPDWEYRMNKLREHAEFRGVSFSQSHMPFNEKLYVNRALTNEDYLKYFSEICKRSIVASSILGVKWVTVHPFTNDTDAELDFDAHMRCNLDFYLPLAEMARKYNVGLAFENIPEVSDMKTKRRFSGTVDEQIALIDAFADPSVGACWDFGHGHLMLRDQRNALRKIGSRLKATHVQDNRGDRDSHSIPFVLGTIKWEDLMPILKEIGYNGDFTYEVQNFAKWIPDALRPSAIKFVYETGEYLLSMYDNA